MMMDRNSYGIHNIVIERGADLRASRNGKKIGSVPGAVDEPVEESERTCDLLKRPTLSCRFGARLVAAGFVVGDAA
jgi:hypothetical protein